MSKIIESLTKEQEAQLDIYYDKWIKIGLKTGLMTKKEKELVEACVYKIYTNQKMATPKVIFVSSPVEAIKEIKKIDGSEYKNALNNAAFGQHDSYWLGFYDYIHSELNLKKETEEILPIIELSTYCNWWFPYDEVCFISEKPIFISINDRGDLHNLNRAAIEYADGFKIYCMNGVECPEWLVETPASKLDPKEIMKIENAEVRKEAIKKIGHSKMFAELKTKIHHEFEDYQLIEFEGLYNKPYAPFLKMINPTTGEIHVEGVSQNCRTVQEALAEKWGLPNYTSPGVKT